METTLEYFVTLMDAANSFKGCGFEIDELDHDWAVTILMVEYPDMTRDRADEIVNGLPQ